MKGGCEPMRLRLGVDKGRAGSGLAYIAGMITAAETRAIGGPGDCSCGSGRWIYSIAMCKKQVER
jgi:hypothetical protein